MKAVWLALCLAVLCQTENGLANEPRKPWTPSTACPKECVCSDSSLTTMRITPPQVVRQMARCNTLPKETVPSSIYSLKVNGVISKVTPGLLAKLNGNFLQTLDLSNCEITHVAKGSFDKLTKLTSLDLSNNKIEAIDVSLFKKNTMLKTLHLNGNMMKEIPDGTFAKCNNLEELNLSRNQLREFPGKLPPKLTTLAISNNNIVVLDAKKMGKTSLKYLDLCYNHVEVWTNAILDSLSQIQALCLGAEPVVLPEDAASHIPNIAHLVLSAGLEDPERPELSHVTRSEIGKMHNLASLVIENYQMDSLSFLLNLTKLIELKLENVMVTSSNTLEMKTIFANNPYLSTISFKRSPQLADIITNSIYMVQNLADLEFLSLQQAGVEQLLPFDVPNSKFRLDISHNPLHCDCQFEWLHQMDVASMHSLLVYSENTTCHAPEEVTGHLLEEFVQTLECNKIPTTEEPQVEEPEPTEMFHLHEDNNDADNVNEDHLNTDQVIDSDQAADTDQANTSDEAGGTDQPNTDLAGNTDEVQNSQGMDFLNEDQGLDNLNTEGSLNADETIGGNQEDDNKENEQTINDERNDEHEEKHDQHSQEESHSSPYSPRHGNDENAKIYIILGCVLLVLVLAGVILGVVYWKYKQDGHKVAPSSGESPIEPIEPTYKQTLATEDTTLIKK